MELAAATLAPRRRAARCFTGLAAHIEMQLLPAEACSRRRDARFTLAGGLCLDAVDILGYPKGYSQPSTPIKWSQKVAVVSSGGGVHIITGNLCPIPAHAHIGAIMPETLESTPPSPTTGAGAQKPKVRPSPEMDAARRRVRQRIREYELSWLLQQRAALACNVLTSWPHWRLR